MSDSVRPHGLQPTRLLRPWDSPGKNTGVGCHFLLQCMKVESESEVAQSCPTLSDPMDCSLPGPPWDFPGNSTGVRCHCLLPINIWTLLYLTYLGIAFMTHVKVTQLIFLHCKMSLLFTIFLSINIIVNPFGHMKKLKHRRIQWLGCHPNW